MPTSTTAWPSSVSGSWRRRMVATGSSGIGSRIEQGPAEGQRRSGFRVMLWRSRASGRDDLRCAGPRPCERLYSVVR